MIVLGGGEINFTDSDHDNLPNYLDADDDNDGITTLAEEKKDSDNDTIPDYLESNIKDTDHDGKNDAFDPVNVDKTEEKSMSSKLAGIVLGGVTLMTLLIFIIRLKKKRKITRKTQKRSPTKRKNKKKI